MVKIALRCIAPGFYTIYKASVWIVEVDKTSPIKIGSSLKYNTNYGTTLFIINRKLCNALNPRHFTVKNNTQILVI